MSAVQARRVIRQADLQHEAAPEKVFELLCPAREHDWIEYWSAEIIFSESGVAENNCIFVTDFEDDGGKEIWVVSRHEPPQSIEFVRLGAHKATKLDIRLQGTPEGCASHWTYTVTALDPEGETYLARLEAGFDQRLRLIETMLNHYLRTGERLPLCSLHAG